MDEEDEDGNQNPAYHLAGDGIEITLERVIVDEGVSVVGIDFAAETTKIEIEFDLSMKSDAGEGVRDPDSYFVELVDGLEGNEEDGANIIGIPSYDDDTDTVTIVVQGIIVSTAKADLPKITILEEVKGGTPPAPLAGIYINTPLAPEDKIGPYLKSASFSFNPVKGKTVLDLIEDNACTLALRFSEKIKEPENIDEDSFISSGNWDPEEILNNIDISDCTKNSDDDWEVVLTIMDIDMDDLLKTTKKPNLTDFPYTAPKFNDTPFIAINPEKADEITDDIAGSDNNSLPNLADPIAVDDGTPLWVVSATTADKGGDKGIVDTINVEFGKEIENIIGIDFEDDVVSVTGADVIDVDDASLAGNHVLIEITLDEEDRDVDTAWRPTVSFDLDEDEDLIIEDATGAKLDMTEDFSLLAEDGVAPVLVNLKTDPGTPSFKAVTAVLKDYDIDEEERLYMVKVQVSETVDPELWEDPIWAKYAFNTTEFSDVSILTFLTSDSDPAGQSGFICGGSTIALLVKVRNDKEVLYFNAADSAANANEIIENGLGIKIAPRDNKEEYMITDLNDNQLANATLYLVKGVAKDKWDIPDMPAGLDDAIEVSMRTMQITGTVTLPDGDIAESGNVYAFHRDELFVIIEELAEDEDTDHGAYGAFAIDPMRCYGATAIQGAGTYYLKAYGKVSADDRGFEDGDAIILVVDTDPANGVFEIGTTACLSNTKYSCAFSAGYTNLPTEKDIYLNEREVITLNAGWNLVSTSIAGAYVDADLLSSPMYDIDPAKYEGYIYKPGDDLGGEGSLPGADAVYALDNMGDDVSSVLFTLSNAFFTGNVLYDPATDEAFPVFDELANRVNETPALAAGRGYYIKVEKTKTLDPVKDAKEIQNILADGYTVEDLYLLVENKNNWQIVIFGEPIPSADCKVRMDDNRDLVGQWGNVLYYTYDGEMDAEKIEPPENCLPSTYEEKLMVIDLARTADNAGEDEIAMMVTDEDGKAKNVKVLSTFFNYVFDGGAGTIINTKSWFGEKPDYTDLYMLPPGSASWTLVDGTDGPFFVNFLMPPEEED
jgi:hypothetical protein